MCNTCGWIVQMEIKSNVFSFLTGESISDSTRKEFSKEIKSQIFIPEVLKTAFKCKTCNGYIHTNSISFDHVEKK